MKGTIQNEEMLNLLLLLFTQLISVTLRTCFVMLFMEAKGRNGIVLEEGHDFKCATTQ